MAILTPPAEFIPSRLTPTLVANTQSGGRSPFDGTEQTLELPGARWAATLAFEGLTEAEWRPVFAFIASLGGGAGRFAWALPILRRGTRTAGVVGAAGQTGKTLATTGWTGSGTAARAGDLIGWNDPTGRPQLHIVTADVTPVAGAATLAIAPAIRRSPNAAAALALTAPTAVWKLAGDRNPMEIVTGLIAGGSLEIEEALV